MLEKIDHVGIAVHSLETVKTLFKTVFNLMPAFEETVEEQLVHVAGFKVGESNLEFLEPINEKSPVAVFLEKRGEGIHHLAVAVDDIEATLDMMKSNNMRLIDEKPRKGAEGKLIAFVHPKSANGMLLELSQQEK